MKLNILFLLILGVLAYNHLKTSSAQGWDSYIDMLIEQTKDTAGHPHCDKACIIGLDDGAKWTTDGPANALKLSADEAVDIARCFKSQDFTAFMTKGIYCEGVQYQFLREEDNKIVYGKKKGEGAVTLQASKTAVVIGHTAEGNEQGYVNKGVAAMAEYLESMDM